MLCVHAPTESKEDKECRVGNHSVQGTDAEHSHNKVGRCGEYESDCHKTLDIGPICQKAVDELAYSIDPIEARTNHAQLGCSKQLGIDERLFHNTHREAANIIERIAQRAGKEGLHTQTSVEFRLSVCGNLTARRVAYCEKFQDVHPIFTFRVI